MNTKKFRLVPVEDETNGVAQSARDLRKAEIIKAAGEAFVEDGYASFSVRNVAKKVGVALSTVQHYYPSKEALLLDMVADKLSSYIGPWRVIADSKEKSAEDRLLMIANDLLDEILKPAVCAFFFEMFALAQHELGASGVLQAFYAEYRALLKDLAIEINPDLNDAQAAAAAMLIAAQVEGLMIFTYHGGENLPDWELTRAQTLDAWINLCFPRKITKSTRV